MRSLAIDKSLEGVAGPPLAMLTVPGSVPVSSSLGPLEGRTLYIIMDIINTSGAWSSPGGLGVLNEGQLLVQMDNAGTTFIKSRIDTVNGSSNLNTIKANSARIPGKRVIAWASVSNGMNTASGGVNDYVGRTVSCTPGNGMGTNPSLNLLTRSDVSGIFAAAYRGEHNIPTRAKILNWLTQRYNMTP